MFLSSVLAAITLGAPFSDGAVLQRGMKVPVWGKVVPDTEGLAKPGEGGPKVVLPGKRKITVTFAGQSKTVESDMFSGRWKVEFDPMETSAEGRTMIVVEKKPGFLFDSTVSSLEIKDVLVGEVWFASGQSNMECPIWGSACRYRDFEGGLMTTMTRLPNVRYVKVPRNWSVEPEPISAKWCKFIPEDLQSFCVAKTGSGRTNHNSLSAVAFYYARELYLALGIPVGIVDASWGGVNIDCFIPRCGWDDCAPEIKWLADYKLKKDWKAETDKKDPVSAAHKQPTVLWNAMVDAFTPMAMRGFIWYQGCSNHGEGDIYALKMHALYNGWSQKFENPNLRLYYVQLAPWGKDIAKMQIAQAQFECEQPNAAMAIVNDVGNLNDIHPNEKGIVGIRLALHALKRDYGFADIQDNSPTVKGWKVEGDTAVLAFDNAKWLYQYNPDFSLTTRFELAGADGVFKPAEIQNFVKGKRGGRPRGRIDGAEIRLKAEGVSEPVRVRYLHAAPWTGNVYNDADLPLGAFELGR